MSWPVRLTTSTLRTSGHFSSASSTAGLSAGGRAAAVAAVGGDHDAGVAVLDPVDAAPGTEKPPNTTVCGAPIRAQASIATTVSGIIGM